MADQRIISDATIADGKPIIAGTQISVHRILTGAAGGMSPQEIVAALPGLSLADVSAAFSYAATLINQQTDGSSKSQAASSDQEDNQEEGELDLNKILVVDDTPLNLEFMKVVFGTGEFTLSVANNGEEGWAKVQSEAPFLILSDIQMPGMSGLKLCRKIKADPKTKNASVIFITNYGQDTSLVSKGLNMGADDFISRPLDKDELLARVRAVARLKRAELEAQRQAKIVAKRNKGLELLNALAVAITSSLDLQQIFLSAMQKLSELLEAEAISILLIDRDTQELTLNIGAYSGEYISQPLPVERMIDLTSREQIATIILDALHHPRYKRIVDPPLDLDSFICLPMIKKEQPIGAIAIINKQGPSLRSGDWVLLHSAVSLITVAVENVRLFNKVQEFNRYLEQRVRDRTGELNQEKKKVEAILVSMADGVLVFDDENRISTVNIAAQKTLGASSDALLGLSLTSEALDSPLWDAVRKLIDSPELTASTFIDVPDPTKAGGLAAVQANSATLRTEAGQIIGTVLVLSDVTAIVEVERMKARFMAGVTHELKTPLAVIKVHTNNLATYHARLPEQKRNQLLTTIQGQVNLLEQLVGDILELSRFDASVSKIERQPTNLVEVADQVVAEMQPLVAEKGITLHWANPTTNVTIQADPNKIDWLLRNLVDNAIKYTPANGAVKIEVLSETHAGQLRAVIQVSDSGIGIPPEEHPRIFERFYRVDSSHTIPGTGLGLSIVKEIAVAHGGQVTVQSPAAGGSIFTVTLPEG